jgi:hypothetical protein
MLSGRLFVGVGIARGTLLSRLGLGRTWPTSVFGSVVRALPPPEEMIHLSCDGPARFLHAACQQRRRRLDPEGRLVFEIQLIKSLAGLIVLFAASLVCT